MLSKASNWLMLAGVAVLSAGLLCVPAMIERRHEVDLVAMGSCLFGVGAFVIASGLYFKTQLMRSEIEKVSGPRRRMTGGCELCATESQVVHCKVHQLDLCGNCLSQHYDFRSCAYVPALRGASTSRRAARAHGA